MADMSQKQNRMAEQEPNVRNKNFSEVALGYTEEQAIAEARRCLGCKTKPCTRGCPVGIDIPSFIANVAQGDFDGAYEVISRSSSLPAVCGRVCPQETQCEQHCVRGAKGEPVAIGKLERFVADRHAEKRKVHLCRRQTVIRSPLSAPVPQDFRAPAHLRKWDIRSRFLKRFTPQAACLFTVFPNFVCRRA